MSDEPSAQRAASGTQTPPLLIALTGGIASGKTAVASLFAELGVPVIDTDQLARDVVEPGSAALCDIVSAFGEDVLDASGRLDRVRMRDRVFDDPDERRRLEAIVHPAIRAELNRRSLAAGGIYQVHVIPLLIERARAEDYDRVLLVDCPEEEQARRLMARDGSNARQVRQILDAQATREARLSAADDVIVNTGTQEDLRAFVETLHQNYLLIGRNRSK